MHCIAFLPGIIRRHRNQRPFMKGNEMKYLKNMKSMNAVASHVNANSNKGVADSFPYTIAITALEKCNFKCITCFQDHERKAEVSWEALEKLKDVLPFVQNVAITGGEPFLYRHLDQFLQFCHESQCGTIIQTNGSLLTERRCNYVIQNGVSRLKISIDGAKPKTYNRIRKGGDFFRLMTNLKRLSDMKKAAGVTHPLVEFNYVAMRSNIRELIPLVMIAQKMDVAVINVLRLRSDYDEMARESLFFEQELSDEIMATAFELGRKVGVYVAIPTLFCEAPGARDGGCGPKNMCRDPWNGMTVNVSGEVAICCGGAGNAGNLNTMSFDEVWNHPWRVKVRETVNTANELPCCQNCRTSKPDPKNILSHIPNPELAKKTMAEFGLPEEEIEAVIV